MKDQSSTPSSASRRAFLSTGSALTGGALLASGASAAPLGKLAGMAHVANNETLRVGLIGCGGRGTGAAANALRADPNVKLVAMGDAFGGTAQWSETERRSKEAIR